MKMSVTVSQKLNVAFSFLLASTLAFLSGWRDEGIDRVNYIQMYFGVVSSDDFFDKLLFAKDFLFLLLSSLASYFSNDAKLALLLICAISVCSKYFLIQKVAPRLLLSFFVVYIVLLSPGLEFAAVRSGASIGFLMLAIAYNQSVLSFAVFSLLAISSHMALLPCILLACRPFNVFMEKKAITSFIVITLFTAFLSGRMAALFPRYDEYADNYGTYLSYALPVSTLIIADLIYFRFKKNQPLNPVFKFIKSSKPVIFGLIAIALGLSGEIVTASTRYLEIAWCLMILPMLVLWRKSLLGFLGLVGFVFFMSYMNIIRFTWMAIVSPN